jgi:hypothetical protein
MGKKVLGQAKIMKEINGRLRLKAWVRAGNLLEEGPVFRS